MVLASLAVVAPGCEEGPKVVSLPPAPGADTPFPGRDASPNADQGRTGGSGKGLVGEFIAI